MNGIIGRARTAQGISNRKRGSGQVKARFRHKLMELHIKHFFIAHSDPWPLHATPSELPPQNIWAQFISLWARKSDVTGMEINSSMSYTFSFVSFGGACGVGWYVCYFPSFFFSLSLSCCGGLRVGELFFVDFLSTIILFSLAMLLARYGGTAL